MEPQTKYYLGFLVLVILSSSFYIMFDDEVRLDFQSTRTLFKVYEEDRFVLAATEYVRIFDITTEGKEYLAHIEKNRLNVMEGISR